MGQPPCLSALNRILCREFNVRIDDVIEKLQAIRKAEGNIEVTCTAATLPDGYSVKNLPDFPDVYESTVESFQLLTEPKGNLEKRVRLYF